MKKLCLIFVACSIAGFANESDVRAVIESPNRTVLSSQIAGKIIKLPKNDGDFFKKGEILAQIDCDVYKAQMDKAAVIEELAKAKLEKNKDLQQLNSVSKFEVITSELEYKKEAIEHQITRFNVDRCSIAAPYDGRIVARRASKFQTVKPHEEIIEIVESSGYEARVLAPSSWLNQIKNGRKFKLYVDELQTTVNATIKQIDAVVDPRSQTISFRATIESAKVLPGMSATATINKE